MDQIGQSETEQETIKTLISELIRVGQVRPLGWGPRNPPP